MSIFSYSHDDDEHYSQNIGFRWNYTPGQIADRKGINRDFYYDFGKALIEWYAPYVPMDEGKLSSYVQAHPAKDHVTINYQMPYAEAQYTGSGKGVPGEMNAENWARHTPLTTSYWDSYAWAVSGDLILRDAEKIRRRHAHQ